MQPHAAALINVLIYLLQDTASKFVVVVTYMNGRKGKTYEIEVISQSANEIHLRVAGLWSCNATIYSSSGKWSIRHAGEVPTEEFTLSSSSISSGMVRNSDRYSSFSGHITDQKTISLNGSYNDQPARYDSKIINAY